MPKLSAIAKLYKLICIVLNSIILNQQQHYQQQVHYLKIIIKKKFYNGKKLVSKTKLANHQI
jgi:hypothetical protein